MVMTRDHLSLQATHMAALSAMQLDDVRKFFPQEYFPYWIVMGKYEKVKTPRQN